jgi:hypothetical protein
VSDLDLRGWQAEEPPPDFAERVVKAAMTEGRGESAPRRRARLAWAVAGTFVAASAAAAAAWVVRPGRADEGDITAEARREARVGDRAVAVLEPGAHVRWRAGAIEQVSGDVFWRVEPGARFVVHTAAADVAVKGTCFRVRLNDGRDAMTRRDAWMGAAGAVVGVAAFVGVYEGKVAVSHAGQSVDVAAGQGARADGEGVHLVPSESNPAETARVPASLEADPLLQANANLVDTVHDYKRRLEALAAEKKKVEKDLAVAEAKLADAGQVKSDYELTPSDWKKLAAEGEVRMRVPCAGDRNDFTVSASDLNALGLAPQDAPVIQAALQRSNSRAWGVVGPLCSQALGDANVERLGLPACMAILQELAEQKDHAAYNEAVHRVAEIEAGILPAPGPNDSVPPIERAYLALANEAGLLTDDLKQTLGPDDARRFVYGDKGCWWNSSHGVGPRDGPAGP